MSTSTTQHREFEEIEKILPTLWKEGLLTDIECGIILSYNKLEEKKEAIYTVITSKTKEEAGVLTEIFRKLTELIHVEENSMDLHNATTESSNEENNYSVFLPSRNPFLNNTIIKHLFGFLPLSDMKQSRLVCSQWNSTAEICLRKRSAIRFRPDVLVPDTFMKASKYSHPDLPFPSFVFSCDENSSWDVSVIQDFLLKWDKNIKEVTFDNVELTRKSNLTGTKVTIPSYNITSLFINPSNITSLKIKYPVGTTTNTGIEISLEKFVSIKTLWISECNIIFSAELQNPLIAPLNISLQRVSYKQNGDEIDCHYNNFVDFSKALNINLEDYMFTNDPIVTTFDMGKQVFNLNQLHLAGVSLENWVDAKGDVQFCRLHNIPFEEKNQLKIKQLLFRKCKIDLSALPQTLEILQFMEVDFSEIHCSEPLHLPNLKHLSIFGKDTTILQYFSNCTNLEEVLIRCSPESMPAHNPYILTISCVPQHVKRLILDEVFLIEFADNSIYEVNTLILKYCKIISGANNCTATTAQIKAKELIIIYYGQDLDIDTSDIVKIVLANTQSQKIIIKSYSDLHKKTPFKVSEFSKYVDKKSNMYQFENNVGKSITEKEIPEYAETIYYFPDYFFEW